MPGIFNPNGPMGWHSERTSQESAVLWGRHEFAVYDRAPVISSIARDTGNAPTTVLRAGLVLGKITATGEYAAYNPALTTDNVINPALTGGDLVNFAGVETACAILTHSISVLDPVGTAQDTEGGGYVLIGGRVKVAELVGFDGTARRQLSRNGAFVFDDGLTGIMADIMPREVAKTADYTIVAADNQTEFTNAGASGAVVFTLPAIAKGYVFDFSNLANQSLRVNSAEGENMVLLNNATADAFSLSTANAMIGGKVRVYTNAAGTAWRVENRSAGAATITAIDA